MFNGFEVVVVIVDDCGSMRPRFARFEGSRHRPRPSASGLNRHKIMRH